MNDHDRDERLQWHPDEQLSRKVLAMTTLLCKRMKAPRPAYSTGWRTFATMTAWLDGLFRHYGSREDYETITDYCIWAVYMRRNIKTEALSLEAYFPKDGFEKFKEADEDSVVNAARWIKRGGVSRSNLRELVNISEEEHPMAIYIFHKCDDFTKDRLLNLKAGFLNCQIGTLLWSPLSDPCNECVFADECKKGLQATYPELYRLRVKYLELE